MEITHNTNDDPSKKKKNWFSYVCYVIVWIWYFTTYLLWCSFEIIIVHSQYNVDAHKTRLVYDSTSPITPTKLWKAAAENKVIIYT